MDYEFQSTFDELLDELPCAKLQHTIDWLHNWDTENVPATSSAEPVIQPQSSGHQAGQNVGWMTTEAAAQVFQPSSLLTAGPNTLQPAQCSQAGTFSQGQWIVNNGPTSGPASLPVAPANPWGNVPVTRLPPNAFSDLQVVSYRNGETGAVVRFSKKRKRADRQAKKPEFIKKPLNAFMLFLKDQRANVVADNSRSGSASVNKLLAERWKSMSEEQKARYKEQARRAAEFHAQQHPGWSAGANYGKSEKRRMLAPTKDNGRTNMLSRHIYGPVTVAPRLQGGVVVNPDLHGGVAVNPDLQGAVAEDPHFQEGVSVNPDLHGGVAEETHLQGGVAEDPNLQGGVAENPHFQGGVAEDPHLQGGVAENPNVQGGVAENPHFQGGVAEDPHLQGGVVENPNLQGGVAEDPHLQGGVVEDHHLQGEVAENPHIQGGKTEDPHLYWPLTEDADLHWPLTEDADLQEGVTEAPDHQSPITGDPNIMLPVMDKSSPPLSNNAKSSHIRLSVY